jgi:hypothetical protein
MKECELIGAANNGGFFLSRYCLLFQEIVLVPAIEIKEKTFSIYI